MNFVFDIDGTLCFDGQHIDNRIISRLKQLQSYGHQVILHQHDLYVTYCQ